MQVLPVEGQNSGSVEPLLITPQQFQAYWTATGPWWSLMAFPWWQSPTWR